MTWGGGLRTETFVLWLKELLSLEMCFVALIIPTSNTIYIPITFVLLYMLFIITDTTWLLAIATRVPL